MAKPGAELSRDVVACPGADTCNLAVSQSRGLARAIGERLEEEGLADVGGVRTNISGCTNSCGQHHAYDIGFQGAERRAHGHSAPGYQMLLGGYVADEQMVGGAKAVAEGLADLDEFPPYDEHPEFYIDYDETGPYVAEVGESECAT
jgi:sulfite reductase beta subunit-like hemoprotein